MTDIQDTTEFDSLMSPDLKEAVDDVITELTSNFKLTNLNSLTELSIDVINNFFNNNNIKILPEFKKNITTPFSIARYLMLTVQQNENLKLVEADLSALLNKDIVDWTIYNNFTNHINFTKIIPINSEEKPQGLLVKYRLNPENDNLIYSIISGNWGWDITKQQLKGLLEGSIISKSENVSSLSINYVDIVKNKAKDMLNNIQDSLIQQLDENLHDSNAVIINKAKIAVLKELLQD